MNVFVITMTLWHLFSPHSFRQLFLSPFPLCKSRVSHMENRANHSEWGIITYSAEIYRMWPLSTNSRTRMSPLTANNFSRSAINMILKISLTVLTFPFIAQCRFPLTLVTRVPRHQHTKFLILLIQGYLVCSLERLEAKRENGLLRTFVTFWLL